MSRSQICITLDEEVLEKVRKVAQKDERSISYMINLYIRNGLREPREMKRLIQRNPGRSLHSREIQEVI